MNLILDGCDDMRLRDWLKTSNISIKSFAREVKVERAMVYRYFTGAMPRARTMRRIDLLTNGSVTAQDFYHTAMEHRDISSRRPGEDAPSTSASKAAYDR